MNRHGTAAFWAATMGCALALAACGKKPDPAEVAKEEGLTKAKYEKALMARKAKCPAPVSTRAAGAPVDDVVGIRVGMTVPEVENLLLCDSKLFVFEFQENRNLERQYGIKTRALFTATTGDLNEPPGQSGHPEQAAQRMADQMMEEAMDRRNGIYRDHEWPTWSRIDQKLGALIVGPQGQEQILGVKREQTFAEGKQPPLDSVVASLKAKYGPPSKEAPEGGLYWIYDPTGRIVPAAEFDGSPLAACGENIDGDPDRGWSWAAECGLTIYAHVSAAPENQALASGTSVGLIDQAVASRSMAAFEEKLAAQDAARKQTEVNKAQKSAPAAKF